MPKRIEPLEERSYLDRLQFDPKLAVSWVMKYITNIRIVILLIITIVCLGLVSYFNLPRRLNPEIKIPIVTIVTPLPGASPEDVESLVTIPLENAVRGLSGLDTVSSTSRDNVSVITLQFTSQVAQEKAKNDTQSAIDSVTGLPDDAQTPQVAALDFEDQPIWTFAVRQDEDDLPSLMRFADDLRTRLEDEPKIDRVTVSGFETQEIVIEADPAKIQSFGINPLQLSAAIKAAVHSLPAGTVDTSRNTFSLTIDPTILSIQDLRTLRINVSGVTVQLGDVATIKEQSKPDQRAAYLASANETPKRIVTMNVYKLQSAKINEAGEAAKKIIDQAEQEYQHHFSIITISNMAEMVSDQFTDLLGEFRTTILLVFGCLLLFLGLRQAIISSFTVPLTFLSAFALMNLVGMSINFLSLFAFLLALGLLVDDTIVVVSAMTTYYKTRKFTPAQTGALVWRDTIVPIWSTTITTIWSFVPLLLSYGIIGEFIKPIPIVVTVTMLSSTAIAVLITLPFMIVLLKPQLAKRVKVFFTIIAFLLLLGFIAFVASGNQLLLFITLLYLLLTWVFIRVRKPLFARLQNFIHEYPGVRRITEAISRYSNHGILNIEPLAQWYYRLIQRVLRSQSARRKVVFAIVTYSVVAFLLLPLGLVKNEFFPKTDGEQLYVNLELPAGTTLETTRQETAALLETLRTTQYMDFVTAEIGKAVGFFGGGGDSQNAVMFTLHFPPKEERPVSTIAIAEKLRTSFQAYTKGTLQIVEESSGPPAGADLQINLSGDDLSALFNYADKVEQHLKAQPGVTNVQKSIKPGTSALVFVPDTQKLAAMGLDAQSVGLWLRAFASGFTLDEVNFTNKSTDKRDIVFRFGDERPHADMISSIVIPTPTGGIPLASLGTIKTKSNPTVITREEGKRTISVSGTVQTGFSVTDKSKELETFATNELNLAPGYAWATGGVNEENAKSVQSILQAMVVSVILILVTMVLQFQSYRQAIIVLLVIPLAVSSVFVIFALTGTPLSFPALIGVLSLFGIVVTNSMFIVDKINLNQKQGMPFIDAIADAGASRLEPIILTKLCTVLGLLPITIADPLWRGLGGAIISGLLLASTIMLLFIPVVYYQWFNGQQKKIV